MDIIIVECHFLAARLFNYGKWPANNVLHPVQHRGTPQGLHLIARNNARVNIGSRASPVIMIAIIAVASMEFREISGRMTRLGCRVSNLKINDGGRLGFRLFFIVIVRGGGSCVKETFECVVGCSADEGGKEERELL